MGYPDMEMMEEGSSEEYKRPSSRQYKSTKEEKKKIQRRETKNSKSANQQTERTHAFVESELYQASKCITIDHFVMILRRASAAQHRTGHEILLTATPAGNTYLHVAAKHGNEQLLAFIIKENPSLVLMKNFSGETALHLAARAGYESMVKALVQTRHDSCSAGAENSESDTDENNLLRAKNERGNTALHEALIYGWDSIAQYLIQTDPEGSYIQNNKGESALYLAAKAGFANCFLIPSHGSSTLQDRLMYDKFEENFPVRAAIEGNSKEVFELMLKYPSLIQSRDAEGRTPLHHAASLGYLEGVCDLLNHCRSASEKFDESGSLPIHLASKRGHLDIVKLLLLHSYDPEELLDYNGRNILHVAAENGRYNIVSYVLTKPALENLINMKDKHGSTTLHLATINWHPKIVSALTWDKRVDIESVDDTGMTALDAARCYMSDNPPFRQRLTWAALVAAGTPRFMSGKRKTIHRQTSTKSSNMENFKERVNTLLLVATLVATITFAAGFTVPGGYNSSDTDLAGMATMIKHKGFHLFIFCDTIAMYSSIVVVVALIWGQLGDLALVINVLTWALPLLGIAFTMMSMAFMAGIFIVVSKLRWLSTIVLVIGIPFLVILSVLLVPLCIPFTSRKPVLRYLSYYPYYLVLLVTSREPTD